MAVVVAMGIGAVSIAPLEVLGQLGEEAGHETPQGDVATRLGAQVVDWPRDAYRPGAVLNRGMELTDADYVAFGMTTYVTAMGVREAQIEADTAYIYEQESTARALEMAAPDDLVLVLGDNIKRTWKQIIYFNSGAKIVESPSKAPSTLELPDVGDFSFGGGVEIISDERGVRIAREEGD